MIRGIMLESFRGTIDAQGIRSLRPEGDEEFAYQMDKSAVHFWAVLSQQELPRICDALASGDRQLATKLVFEAATSMGSIIPS